MVMLMTMQMKMVAMRLTTMITGGAVIARLQVGASADCLSAVGGAVNVQPQAGEARAASTVAAASASGRYQAATGVLAMSMTILMLMIAERLTTTMTDRAVIVQLRAGVASAGWLGAVGGAVNVQPQAGEAGAASSVAAASASGR